MGTARKVDAVLVLEAKLWEGDLWLKVPCLDYDAYAALPDVVSHGDHVCGKTGWNSDYGTAYYSSGARVALALR